MSDRPTTTAAAAPLPNRWLQSIVLLATIISIALILAAWKYASALEAGEAASNQPEPVETITAAGATERDHRETVTSIGTVLALRSITLRNELPGTVKYVHLTPGRIVEEGALLVALDVSVEEAKASGLVARAIERTGARGVSVAPKAL